LLGALLKVGDPRTRAAEAVAAEMRRQQTAGGAWGYEKIANAAIDAFSASYRSSPEDTRAAIARAEEKIRATPKP
jgi:hypothetical protein